MLAIVVNAVQIGVLLAFVLYVLTAGPEARNSWSLQFMVIAGALMAAWGRGCGHSGCPAHPPAGAHHRRIADDQ